MKADLTTKFYSKAGIKENHENVNKYLKAVILSFDGREVIVENDNFKKRRKYADFTEGKKKAGLHPMQIVFSGVNVAKLRHTKYINADGEICRF